MRLGYDEKTEAFREQFVAWLETNLPDPALTAERPTSSADIPAWARQFQRQLFDDGWLSPTYPPELGGRNADLFVVAERHDGRADDAEPLRVDASGHVPSSEFF